MKGKIVILILLVALGLSACSSGQKASTTTAAAPAVSSTPAAPTMSLEGKLAAGTLLLEGTDNAVTADQAKTLLPLWKAVSALASADATTDDEIQAVYRQIQEAMTAEQIDAIEALEMSGETMTSLMSQYGVEPGGEMITRQNGSSNRSGSESFPPAGAVGPGSGQFSAGGPPPDGGGRFFVQGGDASGGPPSFSADGQSTPAAGSGSGRRMMGMNNLFVQPLITLLKERAG